ncbi:DNA cytosine methyltransferase [Streptomyces sp. FR-108]|uniref:DNA cytosine methyltransferase n=1 Tax=Streptomyces sp. FR-108 TaxID=3416665 RepID=UPI003CED7E0C
MSGLSLLDLFCGGGGSSYGASLVPGVTVRMAANHWATAIDVHQLNHPNADHDCADISQVDPRRYPACDLLWASPSCTKHSVAQGKARAESSQDVDAERSRATMWDVQRFTEYHRYRFIFVENVVEVRRWSGFRGWKISMEDTGYCLHEVFLNAAFAGQLGPAAAQWRDRWFCLAHPKGTPCPDTQRWTCPTAWCDSCEASRDTYQAWKNPEKQAGKYRAQYVYRCRTCNGVTEPLTRPASDIINWSDLGTRIGDRKRPLAEKTLNRIRIGLDRYGSALVPVEGRDGKIPLSLNTPMRTCTTRNETGLLVPAGGTWNDTAYPVDRPTRTVTTRETTGLVVPPFIAELRGGNSTVRPVAQPLATVTASGNHHGLVVPYYSTGVARPTSDPLRTVTTVDTAALVRAQTAVDDCLFRMLSPQEYASAMAFPEHYEWMADSLSKRLRVRLAGNAVPPNMARDLVACAIETI